MKTIFVSTLLVAAFVLTGCSTVDKKFVAQDGIQYTDAKHGIKVWKADNVDLAKYRTLVVPRPVSKVPPEKKEEERQQFERLLTDLQGQLSSQLLSRSLVSAATVANTNSPATTTAMAGPESLVLETEIVEYYRGSPALRFTVGFGAGWPTILVKGTLKEAATGTPILRFAANRGFEPRPFEYDDETLLAGNVRDLAADCAEVIVAALNPKAAAEKTSRKR